MMHCSQSTCGMIPYHNCSPAPHLDPLQEISELSTRQHFSVILESRLSEAHWVFLRLRLRWCTISSRFECPIQIATRILVADKVVPFFIYTCKSGILPFLGILYHANHYRLPISFHQRPTHKLYFRIPTFLNIVTYILIKIPHIIKLLLGRKCFPPTMRRSKLYDVTAH